MAIQDKVQIIVTAEDQASGVFGKIGGALGGVGKAVLGIAAGGVVAGLAGLGAGLGVAMSEAMEGQEAVAQLDAVIKSTGGSAGVTRDMALGLADSLQGVTRFSDDAVLAGENMLLTFTNIGSDVFPEATKTLADMATATGQDLAGSAVQLGKALNDPIAGISALSRVGVTFTDQQKEMIKGMVEAGDVAGAQKVILAELSKEFGGSAEAAGATFSGQLDILKNSLLNVAETAGTSLIPILTTGLQSITPVITQLATDLAAFLQSEGFKKFLSDVAAFIADPLIPSINQLIQWLQVNLPPAIAFVVQVWNSVLKPALEWLWNFLQTYIFPALATFGAWLTVNIPAFLNTLKTLWDNNFLGIKTIFDTFMKNIRLLWKAFELLFKGDFEGFGKTLRTVFDNTVKLVQELVQKGWDALKKIDWKQLGIDMIKGIENGIISATDWVIKACENLAKAVLKAIKGFLGIKSPSKVMADQVGKPMAEGLMQGFVDNMPDISGTVKGFSVGAGGLRGSAMSVNVFSPVIQYQPFISNIDQKEAEYKLKPLIENIMRGAG